MRDIGRVLLAHELVKPGDALVVGVSGGPDSLSLLHILHCLAAPMELRLVAAHVNYRLRGRAAERDAATVQMFAKALRIPCRVKRCARPPRRGNLQDWARRVRYAFFATVARAVGAAAVAVAHHEEDQCETVLMNLVRGSHLEGLCGMAVARPLAEGLRLIRPALACQRASLAAYARRWRLPVCHDATNATGKYQRNRIRHRLLPLLRQFNPHASTHVARTAARLREERALLEQVTALAYDRSLSGTASRPAGGALSLRRAVMTRWPPALVRRVLRHAVAEFRGTTAALQEDHLRHMEAIARGQGRAYSLPGDIRFVREGDLLRFERVTHRSRRRPHRRTCG